MVGVRMVPLALSALVWMTSCAVAPQGNAEDSLTESMSRLQQQKSYSYEGTLVTSRGGGVQLQSRVEGFVRGPGEVYVKVDSPDAASVDRSSQSQSGWVRIAGTDSAVNATSSEWNPQRKIEQLQAAIKSVKWIKAGANGDKLSATLDSGDAAKQLAEDWTKLLGQMNAAEKGKAEGQTDERREAWLKEIDAATNRMRARLDDLLPKMTVQTTYEIEIDRQTQLPRTLLQKQTIRYPSDEQQREETLSYTYSFKEIGRDILIPSG